MQLVDGSRHAYDALLLATGAEPVRLDVPGSDLPHVHYLRTLADSRALVAKALTSKRAVVIGASFIGLEVAASLRARNIEVHVVAPETDPDGENPRTGGRHVHPRAPRTTRSDVPSRHYSDLRSTSRASRLKSGEHLPADLVVIGIGVRPVIALAEQAGLADRSRHHVNEYLETSVPGIFAAGDIARWPDRLTGERIRVEHWVVAERQGQTAARNMLGRRERFDAVPFFWTEQYDFSLAYVGHAERWDEAEIDGQLDAARRTARSPIVAVAGSWPWLSFTAILKVCARKSNSRGRSLVRTGLTAGHNQPPVNPARRNPVTTYGRKPRIRRHNKPVR